MNANEWMEWMNEWLNAGWSGGEDEHEDERLKRERANFGGFHQLFPMPVPNCRILKFAHSSEGSQQIFQHGLTVCVQFPITNVFIEFYKINQSIMGIIQFL